MGWTTWLDGVDMARRHGTHLHTQSLFRLILTQLLQDITAESLQASLQNPFIYLFIRLAHEDKRNTKNNKEREGPIRITGTREHNLETERSKNELHHGKL